MEYRTYIQEIRRLYENFLAFIDDDECNEGFGRLGQQINDMRIRDNKEELEHFLRIIVSVSNNHHRTNHFFDKIEQVLQLFENQIKQTFSKYEIFRIFGSNKKLLLYIFKNKISTVSSYLEIYSNKFTTDIQTRHFFLTELKNLNEKSILDSYNDYEELRQKGENDTFICSLIRNDSVVDFVTFVTKKCIPLSSEVKPSIFETNRFLNESKHSLIEYAAFFGAIQIVKYLRLNGIELKPSLWRFAIHSNNPEMIYFLDECDVKPPRNSYIKCYKEAIKCHHNDVAQYFENKMILNEEDKVKIMNYGLRYFNCLYYPEDLDFEESSKINYVEIVNHFFGKFLGVSDYLFYKAGKKNDIDHVYYLLLKSEIIEPNNLNSIASCIIPPTIKTIGFEAFIFNDRLTSVIIPQSVKSIKSYAFKGCKSLKEIVIPSSVTEIGYKAFCGCVLLKKFEFPPSLAFFGGSLFNGCKSLTEINFPSVETDDSFCLRYCKRLKSIKVPSTVGVLGKQCFFECRALEQVVFEEPISIKYISLQSFLNCISLKQITIPSTVALIGKKAFGGCISLEEIVIPPSVTLIRSYAFVNCSSLKKISFPFVNKIDNYAFYNCVSLKEVIFPSSVSCIGESAFALCTSLQKVVFDKAAPIKQIKYKTFDKCSSLDFLILPSSLTSIDDFSFVRCSSLKEIYIPPHVVSIGFEAFYGCLSLRSIVFESPSSLEVIRSHAFRYCSSLGQIWLPHSLKKIEKDAFYSCFSLEVAIPNGLDDIEWGAFEKCRKCWCY